MGEMRSVRAQNREHIGSTLRTQLPLRAPSRAIRCARSKAKIGLKCYVVYIGSRCSHIIQCGCPVDGARCECMSDITVRDSCMVSFFCLEGFVRKSRDFS